MFKVLIIGAGPAGIGASKYLKENNIDNIVILEARSRIGGRVYENKLEKNFIPNSSDFCNVQLGANWIHGLDADINPLFKISLDMGLDLQITSSDDEPGDDVLLFDYNNDNNCYNIVNKNLYDQVLKRYQWIREQLEEKSDPKLELSFEKVWLNKLNQSEVLFGICTEFDFRCLTWLLDRIAIDLAATVDKISMFSMTEGVSDGAYGEGIVKNGYSKIITAISNEYPIDILLDHIVSEIEIKKDGIIIKCKNGEYFQSEYVICALPLGVLKSSDIKFTPSIPQPLPSLMQDLSSGLMNLIWLWYPSTFWPNDYNFIGITRNKDDNNCDFTTFLIPYIYDNTGVRQSVLMAQVVGKFALEIEELTDLEIANRATIVLRKLFNNVPDALGCMHSAWNKDPFSQGSWSYYDVNSKISGADSNPFLLTSEYSSHTSSPRFHIAGEYLHKESRGTVHGAFITGEWAAKEIISHINKIN